MAQTFFSGAIGSAQVVTTGTNTQTLCINGWEVNPDAAEHRTDNTCDGGYSSRITGIHNCTFTITLPFDSTSNPLDSPPNLKYGQQINGVKLFLNGTASAFWSFPTARVTATPMASRVGDLTTITINGANNGTFSAPAGTFSASLGI
jgi:hypothetical protein